MSVQLLRGIGFAIALFGMGVLGPVVATIGTAGVAAAQAAIRIDVEGNRRVEPDTIRAYFRVAPGERLDASKIDLGAEGALCHRAVPGRPDYARAGPHPRHGGRKSRDQPRWRSRATRRRKTTSSTRRCSPNHVAPIRAPSCSRTSSASSRSISVAAATTFASIPRSSNCRTAGSISSSRSTKAPRPASPRSFSSATRRFPINASRTSSRPAKRICSAS